MTESMTERIEVKCLGTREDNNFDTKKCYKFGKWTVTDDGKYYAKDLTGFKDVGKFKNKVTNGNQHSDNYYKEYTFEFDDQYKDNNSGQQTAYIEVECSTAGGGTKTQ